MGSSVWAERLTLIRRGLEESVTTGGFQTRLKKFQLHAVHVRTLDNGHPLLNAWVGGPSAFRGLIGVAPEAAIKKTIRRPKEVLTIKQARERRPGIIFPFRGP